MGDKDIERKKDELISAFHLGSKIAGIVGWIFLSLIVVAFLFFFLYTVITS